MAWFTAEDRDRVRERVLALADADARVTAGAVVGSLALGPGDRWSDLDLTFAVAEGVAPVAVLDDWARALADEFDAVTLFDLPAGPSLYRVFLLPGCLQVDLSCTPAAEFGARGLEFRPLFGEVGSPPPAAPPDPATLFGHAVHHALHCRIAIERGKLWQAEYWLGALRELALALACVERGLPARFGRGVDGLPAEVLARFEGTLPRALEAGELRRALGLAVEGFLAIAGEAEALDGNVSALVPSLRAIAG